MPLEFQLPRDTILWNALSANVDRDSTTSGLFGKALDMSRFRTLSVQVIWAGLSALPAATFKLQRSNDGSNWSDVPSAVISVTSQNGNDFLETDVKAMFYKVVWSKGIASSGTITAMANAKG